MSARIVHSDYKGWDSIYKEPKTTKTTIVQRGGSFFNQKEGRSHPATVPVLANSLHISLYWCNLPSILVMRFAIVEHEIIHPSSLLAVDELDVGHFGPGIVPFQYHVVPEESFGCVSARVTFQYGEVGILPVEYGFQCGRNSASVIRVFQLVERKRRFIGALLGAKC